MSGAENNLTLSSGGHSLVFIGGTVGFVLVAFLAACVVVACKLAPTTKNSIKNTDNDGDIRLHRDNQSLGSVVNELEGTTNRAGATIDSGSASQASQPSRRRV